jgi:hypothetical protein
MLERLSHLRRQQDGKLPSDGDLETAARAVTGLVEVYRLEAGDLLEGRLGGQESGARLAGQQQSNYSAQQRSILEDLLASQEPEVGRSRQESPHHLIAREVRMTEEDRSSYSALCTMCLNHWKCQSLTQYYSQLRS